MLQQISDYLFIGSLIFLMITFVIFFRGSGGESNYINASTSTGALTDLQMNHDHKKMAENRNIWSLVRLLKSFLFWIPVAGIIVSIVLSKI